MATQRRLHQSSDLSTIVGLPGSTSFPGETLPLSDLGEVEGCDLSGGSEGSSTMGVGALTSPEEALQDLLFLSTLKSGNSDPIRGASEGESATGVGALASPKEDLQDWLFLLI